MSGGGLGGGRVLELRGNGGGVYVCVYQPVYCITSAIRCGSSRFPCLVNSSLSVQTLANMSTSWSHVHVHIAHRKAISLIDLDITTTGYSSCHSYYLLLLLLSKIPSSASYRCLPVAQQQRSCLPSEQACVIPSKTNGNSRRLRTRARLILCFTRDLPFALKNHCEHTTLHCLPLLLLTGNGPHPKFILNRRSRPLTAPSHTTLCVNSSAAAPTPAGTHALAPSPNAAPPLFPPASAAQSPNPKSPPRAATSARTRSSARPAGAMCKRRSGSRARRALCRVPVVGLSWGLEGMGGARAMEALCSRVERRRRTAMAGRRQRASTRWLRVAILAW